MKAVVITRNHPTLNFGQIVDIQSVFGKSLVADALPEGDKTLHRLNKSEYWPCDRANDYEVYNHAVSYIKGWPWSN